MMIKGSCLCERVVYEYEGDIDELAICHCDQCKRAQGTPFVTNAPVKSELFKIIKGEYLLRAFYSSKNKKRVFCSICGSPIFSQRTDKPQTIRIRAGTITSAFDHLPDYAQYSDSKAPWFEHDHELTHYSHSKP